MKKQLSILFILCFTVFPIKAQGQVVRILPRVVRPRPIPPKPPIIMVTPPLNPQVIYSRVPPMTPSNGHVTPPLNPQVIDSRVPPMTGGFTPLNINNLSTPPHNYGQMPTPASIVHFDIENRGFVPERHLSTSQEQQSNIIESNEGNVSSPPIINPPKVNKDKLRLKVMMRSNRLNKNEMKTDEFYFIALLINQNEYGKYYVTNYAA